MSRRQQSNDFDLMSAIEDPAGGSATTTHADHYVSTDDLPGFVRLSDDHQIAQDLVAAWREGKRNHPYDFLLGNGGLSRIAAISRGPDPQSTLLDVVKSGIALYNAETQDSQRRTAADREDGRLVADWLDKFKTVQRGVLISARAAAMIGAAALAVAGTIYVGSHAVGDYFARKAATSKDDAAMGYFAGEDMVNSQTPSLRAGGDLEGAMVRFPCVPTEVAGQDKMQLEPSIGLKQVYDTSTLATLYGVNFEPGEDPAISAAEADYGTTVLFTRDQVADELPTRLGAIPVSDAGGTRYYLPTAAFVPDPEGETNGMFVTGLRDVDGNLLRYYPVSTAHSLACDGETESKAPKMVDGTLTTDKP